MLYTDSEKDLFMWTNRKNTMNWLNTGQETITITASAKATFTGDIVMN